MCTTLFLNGKERLVAKNTDIFYDGGFLFTNQRGLSKFAVLMPSDEPVHWVSRFGSVIVTQVGKESPSGGMNEAGLVMEQMTLPQTQYPANDGRPAIKELPWIQYMLDCCSSVHEVVEHAADIRIAQNITPLHYMAVDRQGHCAVIEYIGGEMVCHTGVTLPLPLLANSTYERSLQYLENRALHTVEDPYERNSLERFATAADIILSLPSHITIEYAFDALRAVQRDDSVWSMVYDIDKLEIYFRTIRQPARKMIALAEIDFSAPIGKGLDIHCAEGGCANHLLSDYSMSMNRQVAHSFFRDPALTNLFQWMITDEMIDFFASYPDQFAQADS